MVTTHGGPTAGKARAPQLAAPAAHRAVRLLEVLAAARGPVGVTAAAQALGVPKSSVTYLFAALADTGMVRRRGHGWVLGFKVLELSRAVLASTALSTEFRRGVARSAELRPETCLLAVLDGTDVVYVDRHDGLQPVRFINEVGSRVPAAVTGLGRAMLTRLTDDEIVARYGDAPLPRPTADSLPDLPALRDDVDRSRARGHALDSGQGVAGVGCVAVAVPGVQPPMAVSASLVLARLDRATEARLAAELTDLATRLADADT